mgnify:CR=1 FL=1
MAKPVSNLKDGADTASKSAVVRKASAAQEQGQPSLKGTFLSVMLLGGFIALTWLGVFVLYLMRN